MPTLMEKAALIAKALGISSSVLDRDGTAGVVRGASAAIGFRPEEGMTLGDIIDAIVLDVVRCRFLGAYSEAQGFRHRFLAPNLKMLRRNFLMLRFLNAHDQL